MRVTLLWLALRRFLERFVWLRRRAEHAPKHVDLNIFNTMRLAVLLLIDEVRLMGYLWYLDS